MTKPAKIGPFEKDQIFWDAKDRPATQRGSYQHLSHASHYRPRNPRRRRRLQIELLESRYVLSGQALLTNDNFALQENEAQTPLAVLSNDSFDADYAGAKQITSVSFGSQGGRLAISADKHQVLYTPPADFSGSETFTYAVDGQFTAQVQLDIQSPLAPDQFTVVPDGAPHTLNVLANDPFWVGYAGPRNITSVSVTNRGGTVSIAPDHKTVLYTAPTDPIGDDTFTYIVDGQYQATVTVCSPTTLVNDLYDAVKHDPPITLDVMSNDPFWAGYTGDKKITNVESSQIGANIQISADGHSLIYTQPSDFGDKDFDPYILDTFHYTVDGKYDATVGVALHRPVKDDYFSVDENSTDFFYIVTQNDRYGDYPDWRDNEFDVVDRVTSVTQSAHGGTVTISADGQGILYTPAPGYSGDDQFTYLADGVHEARVFVQVTQPVHDDAINSGIYQDTPSAVLNVLGNDFIGNGYAGPRLITAVGPTAHGGTVSIRADGKAILYTPAPGYAGQDQFTYMVDGVLQANVTLQVAALAQNDAVSLLPDPQSRPYTIDVLTNDNFHKGYTGAGVLTSVEVVNGGGQASIVNGRIVFDPASADDYTLRYTVDGQYQATVAVSVENVANPDSAVVDENSIAQQINVFANDFYRYFTNFTYYYNGPRVITGVTQSQHGGTVTFAANSSFVSYTPPADFIGTDTFTYTVDNFMTATVTVSVIRRVRDDQFRVDAADGPQVLPVLANDPFGADYTGPGQITAVTPTAGGGTVSISGDGHTVTYQPRAGFVGTDTFTYTVDGTQKAQVSVVVDAPQSGLAKFASAEDYAQFLINDALTRYANLFGQPKWQYLYTIADDVGTSAAGLSTNTPDLQNLHSNTNVQVAGVDEGDVVEFDSDYIYMLSGNDVVIASAWPASQLSIASRFTVEGNAIAEYLNGDRLTIISTTGGGLSSYLGGFWNPLPSSTIVTVLDVSDRAAPTLVQKTKMDGGYVDSRAVGGFVYVLVSNTNAVAPTPLLIDDDNDPLTLPRYESRDAYLARITANLGELVESALPSYTAAGPDGQTVRTGVLNSPEDIYQPLSTDACNLLSIVSFSEFGNEPGIAHSTAVYDTSASTVYASLDHFYILDGGYTSEDGAVTRILRFDWQPTTGGIEFNATTTVPGTIIDQFSIDESGPYLRIATTVHNWGTGNWTGVDENDLFVLTDDDGVFEYVGGMHNLALGESIRSVRFMGDRAFLTTFRTIDPLFAIDLSDPSHPEAVGHVTIPGYSTYMQLIDQNHLLTVGKNTPSGLPGPTEVSLFDISNLLQPERIAEYTFESYSLSEAEFDHHAFGYYSEFGLLAMPVSTTRIERVDTDGDGYAETCQWVNDSELAVFSIDVNAADPADQLKLKTEIEQNDTVRRSGFIGDKLYSVGNASIKVVDIADPDTVIAQLTIPQPDAPQLVSPFTGINPNLVYTNILGAIDDPQSAPAVAPVQEDPLTIAIDHSREAFATKNESATGEALLVTAEASPKTGGGYSVVLEAHGHNYLYHVDADGMAQLVDSDFHFNELVGAWHAIEARPALPHHQSAPRTSHSSAVAISTSVSHGGDRFFTNLGAASVTTTSHHIHAGAGQATSKGLDALSLLVLGSLNSNSKSDHRLSFDRAHDRTQTESSDLDFSDIDDAFDSFASLRLGKRSAVGRLQHA